jgi:hypothetical protein
MREPVSLLQQQQQHTIWVIEEAATVSYAVQN